MLLLSLVYMLSKCLFSTQSNLVSKCFYGCGCLGDSSLCSLHSTLVQLQQCVGNPLVVIVLVLSLLLVS